ncbi:MAG: phosphoribosylamine--glycine ligase, partial [Planctomycetaceae bacterium]
MKVLVVGQGGREHALVWKLSQSPAVSQVFCAPGNAGTAIDGTNVDISADDVSRLVKFAQSEGIALTVIGPEVPLVAGVVDAFKQAKLRVFGPTKAAAQLEGSKVFAKELMRQANVPTADYWVFNDSHEAVEFINDREANSFVI